MSTPSDALPAPADHIQIGGKPLSIADALRNVRGSGSWFWWIGALSVANTVATMLELKYGMMLGLGFTQVFDALFYFDSEGKAAAPGLVGRVVHLALVAAVAGGFYLLGRAARNFSERAFNLGMGIYALDALLFVLLGEWLAVGFHAFVLFMLWGGRGVLRELRRQAPERLAATAAA